MTELPAVRDAAAREGIGLEKMSEQVKARIAD